MIVDRYRLDEMVTIHNHGLGPLKADISCSVAVVGGVAGAVGATGPAEGGDGLVQLEVAGYGVDAVVVVGTDG
jgi:hypothetical protein